MDNVKIKKSFSGKANSAVGIEYRVKRALQTLSQLEMFLNAIDGSVMTDSGSALDEATGRVNSLGILVRDLQTKVPGKKPRKSDAQKAAEAAAKADEKAAKALAREEARRQKTAIREAAKVAKAAAKLKPAADEDMAEAA